MICSRIDFKMVLMAYCKQRIIPNSCFAWMLAAGKVLIIVQSANKAQKSAVEVLKIS